MSFKIEKILNDEDLRDLNGLYGKIEPRHAYQDFNLHNVEKRQIPPSWWDRYEPIRKLQKYANGASHRTHYFLRYMPGSFTSLHCDDKRSVGLTIVTFLQLKNLVGGDTIFIKEFEGVERTPEMYDYFHKDKESNMAGKFVVPDIARDVKVGDSVVYFQDIRHGMTQVKEGQRIVLVSWFKPLDNTDTV